MGCGSSQSIGAVPGSSNDYKYSVLQTWDKVDRTISKGSKVKKNLVVQRSGWKTVRVFVSSTFKDFHAEREILVKEVGSVTVAAICTFLPPSNLSLSSPFPSPPQLTYSTVACRNNPRHPQLYCKTVFSLECGLLAKC